MSASRFAWIRAAALSAALGGAACTSDAGGAEGIIHRTLVAVAPEDFLGSVPCADTPGAMRTYVATLIDVSEELGSDAEPIVQFRLPSSPPVSCDQTVAFNFVASGHRYVAEIQGYDQYAPTDLRPLAPGSPVLLTQDGQAVEPRWSTTCGELKTVEGAGDAGADAGTPLPDGGPGGTVAANAGNVIRMRSATAVSRTTRYVRNCDPLEDSGSLGDTAISVRIESALGSLVCGELAGEVSRFRAVLASTGATEEAACGQSLVFSGLAADVFEELLVAAFEKDATLPRWTTRCWRKTQAGVTLEASCDPLSEPAAQ